jgi:hypothetical protein
LSDSQQSYASADILWDQWKFIVSRAAFSGIPSIDKAKTDSSGIVAVQPHPID